MRGTDNICLLRPGGIYKLWNLLFSREKGREERDAADLSSLACRGLRMKSFSNRTKFARKADSLTLAAVRRGGPRTCASPRGSLTSAPPRATRGCWRIAPCGIGGYPGCCCSHCLWNTNRRKGYTIVTCVWHSLRIYFWIRAAFGHNRVRRCIIHIYIQEAIRK